MSDLLYMYDHTNGDDYILKELDILKRIKRENIDHERCNLYKDFSINLTYLIYETYLGEEYIVTKLDIEGHFRWCYMETCNIYFEQEFNFYSNENIYEFFFEFFLESFYFTDKKKSLNVWLDHWENLFDIKCEEKEEKHMNYLIVLYKIFNTSLEEDIISSYID